MSNLIRKKTVLQRCAMSNSTLYRMIESGDFPPPVQVSKRSVAWVEHEIDEWIQQRMEFSRVKGELIK
jgi:prophage regulatory protein